MNKINIINNDECSFCLEKIDYNKNYTITKCSHKFHSDCIFRILQRYNKCPICCRILNSENIELDLENNIDEEQIFISSNTSNNNMSLCNKIYNFIIYFKHKANIQRRYVIF